MGNSLDSQARQYVNEQIQQQWTALLEDPPTSQTTVNEESVLDDQFNHNNIDDTLTQKLLETGNSPYHGNASSFAVLSSIPGPKDSMNSVGTKNTNFKMSGRRSSSGKNKDSQSQNQINDNQNIYNNFLKEGQAESSESQKSQLCQDSTASEHNNNQCPKSDTTFESCMTPANARKARNCMANSRICIMNGCSCCLQKVKTQIVSTRIGGAIDRNCTGSGKRGPCAPILTNPFKAFSFFGSSSSSKRSCYSSSKKSCSFFKSSSQSLLSLGIWGMRCGFPILGWLLFIAIGKFAAGFGSAFILFFLLSKVDLFGTSSSSNGKGSGNINNKNSSVYKNKNSNSFFGGASGPGFPGSASSLTMSHLLGSYLLQSHGIGPIHAPNYNTRHDDLNEDSDDPNNPSTFIDSSYPCPSWLSTARINFAITGISGVGKSTLINSLRNLKAKDPQAARVGVKETTLEPRDYRFPCESEPFKSLTNLDRVSLWDLPGVGSTNFPGEEYVKSMGLRWFDGVLVVTAERFSKDDMEIIRKLKEFDVPFYLIRNKTDQSVEMEGKEYGKGEDEVLHDLRLYYKAQINEVLNEKKKKKSDDDDSDPDSDDNDSDNHKETTDVNDIFDVDERLFFLAAAKIDDMKLDMDDLLYCIARDLSTHRKLVM